mmetsp:Transcript_5970/g.9677  ORF Transcript_5970/g.9677 Transcript_5970/m.9677 type:complete len:620 (+) Transcript_5970:71-1930(+)
MADSATLPSINPLAKYGLADAGSVDQSQISSVTSMGGGVKTKGSKKKKKVKANGSDLKSKTAPDPVVSPVIPRTARKSIMTSATRGTMMTKTQASFAGSMASTTSMLSHASYAVAADVDTLIEAQLQYSLKIEKKKNALENTNKTIKELQRDIDETRTGSHKPYNDLIETMKKKRLNQHKLKTVNSALSESNNEITALKAEVDNLRSEKIAQRHKELTTSEELEQKQKKLRELLITTQAMHTQREDAKRETGALRREALETVADFTAAFDDLKVQQSASSSLLNVESSATLFTVDAEGHVKPPEPTKQQKRMAGLKSKGMFGLGPDPQEEAARVKDEYAKSYWVIREREQLVEKQAARAAELKALFGRLEAATGHSADRLAAGLGEAEQRAFQLFRLIHDYNHEQEALDDERLGLERQLRALHGRAVERRAKRDRIKDDLEGQIAVLAARTDEFAARAAREGGELEEVLGIIRSIFDKLQLKDTPEGEAILELGLSQHNILRVLSLIEGQLDMWLQVYHAKTKGPLAPLPSVTTVLMPEQGPAAAAGWGAAPAPARGGRRLRIQPPSVDDAVEDEDIETGNEGNLLKFESTQNLRRMLSAKIKTKTRAGAPAGNLNSIF